MSFPTPKRWAAVAYAAPSVSPVLPGRLLLAVAVLVLLLWSAASPAFAQEVRTVTFGEAVRIGLERNIQLKKAGNAVELQSTLVAGERADFLPNLNLSASPGFNWGLQFDQTAGRLISASSNGMSVGANSGINLFNGFADVASLEAARLRLEADEHAYDRTRQAVVFNVVQNYLQVILDAEQVTIRTEDVEAQRQLREQIEAFVNVGRVPISDLYQQQASEANSEALLLEQERALQLSKMRLIQVMELDPLGEYEFETPDIDAIELVVVPYDLLDLMQRAFSRRADLRAQELSIDSAEEDVRAARSGYFPRINLSGNYGTRYTSTITDRPIFDDSGNPVPDPNGDFLREDVTFFDQFNENRGGSISLSLSVPVFNRFQTRSNIQRARVQYENTRLDLQDLQQSVALDVRQAYLDYETGAKRLDVTAKQLQAAEQALRAAQERYDVGATTLVELTQARAVYFQAASNRAQAVYRFVFQSKVIDYYIGTLDPAVPLIP